MLLEFDINDSLSGEFLHNVPANIQEAYPNIQDLIKECVIPKKPFTRIIAGIQLKELLDTILKDNNADTD
ncbi:uncharacterized protein LOC143210600 [Lasioglossum baleicum]|uniref:uncharacterized protein LOC143210600 n=1 Tax=Lasioglossum baleicum TaxID=434251 RepID=UPI003FCD082D